MIVQAKIHFTEWKNEYDLIRAQPVELQRPVFLNQTLRSEAMIRVYKSFRYKLSASVSSRELA